MVEIQLERLHPLFGQVRSLVGVWVDHSRFYVALRPRNHNLRRRSPAAQLVEPTLIVLTLSCEHMQLLFEVLQCLLDRLLAAIAFFITHLERARQMLAILRQHV